MKYLILLLLFGCVSTPYQDSVTNLKKLHLGDSYYKMVEIVGYGNETDYPNTKVITYVRAGQVPLTVHVDRRTMEIIKLIWENEIYMNVEAMKYVVEEE